MTLETIRAEGSSKGVAVVAAAFDAFSRRHTLPVEISQAVQVALDEVLSNVVKSGFEPGAPGPINVSLDVSAGVLEIVVSYHGIPFNPLARKDPETRGTIEDRPVGGLGIFLVKKLMDGVAYEGGAGENRLRMTKRIPV